MKFKIGQSLMTRGVSELIKEDKEFAKFVNNCFTRHINADWGDLCEEDKELNDIGLRDGSDRLFSKYNYKHGVSIYIITEWDRSYTTILFPEEY